MSGKRPDLVELLLDYGVDPDIVHEIYDITPLVDVVESLCYGGMEEDMDENDEEKIEDVARRQKEGLVPTELKIVLLLLDSGADPNWRTHSEDDRGVECDQHRSSILALVARSSLIDKVKILLTAGASPNWRYCINDATALEHAIRSGSNSIINLLLEAGADVNAPACPDGIHGTALQQAVNHQNIDCIRDLMHRGAEGGTALQMAVKWENDKIVHLILDAGADINAPACQSGGRTALQEPAIKGTLAYVRMLLQKGADFNAPPSEARGFTALQAASIND